MYLLSEWMNSDVAASGMQDGGGDQWKVLEGPVGRAGDSSG